MKQSLYRAAGIALFFLGLAGVAFAHGHGHAWGHTKHAPEIDPTSLASGLALLVGSGLLLLEKYRHRKYSLK